MNFLQKILNKFKNRSCCKSELTPLNEVIEVPKDLTPVQELDQMTERLIDVSTKPLKLETPKKSVKKAAKKVSKKVTKKAKPKNQGEDLDNL